MKKNFKVTLSAMLALMMIFSTVPMFAATAIESLKSSEESVNIKDFASSDESNFVVDGIVYREINDEFIIVGCTPSAEEVTIPSSVLDKPVVAIAEGAFNGTAGLENLSTVKIAPTVRKIESKAFESCALLSTVEFLPFNGETGSAAVPDTSEICEDAFFNCESLINISVPLGVVIIGNHAFGYTYANDEYIQIADFTIEGYANTVAYKYANNSFAFSNLYGSQIVTPVQGLTVSPSQGIIEIDEFIQLTPVFSENTPTNQFVRWFSSDNEIAVVDKYGKVTGVSGGEVTITAISSDNLYETTTAITVNGPSVGSKVTAVQFTGSLSSEIATAYYSDSSNLKYKIAYETTPEDAPYNNVAFTYDDTYFTVEYDSTAEAYYLIPKKLTNEDETVELKIYSVAYPSTVFDTVNIRIDNNISGIQWYSFSNGEDTLNVTNTSRIRWSYTEGRLDAKVILLPSEITATSSDFILTSSNENVAYWNASNELIPVKNGETVLTVTSVNGGYTDTITAVLTGASKTAVSGLTFSCENKQVLTYANSYNFSKHLTFNPTTATNKDVTWTSSDPSIASVSDKGVVTCNKRGTAVITATSDENDEMVATCTVTVKFAWWQQILYYIVTFFGFNFNM